MDIYPNNQSNWVTNGVADTKHFSSPKNIEKQKQKKKLF